MLSAVKPVDTVRGLEINTLGDGLFHLGTYSFTIVGLVLLWRRLHQQHRPVPTITSSAVCCWDGEFLILLKG
jgi:uncharacterized membrane protein